MPLGLYHTKNMGKGKAAFLFGKPPLNDRCWKYFLAQEQMLGQGKLDSKYKVLPPEFLLELSFCVVYQSILRISLTPPPLHRKS
jgi:hypothetical protein